MALPGAQLLAACIVNALTFELLVDVPITYIVNNSGPWATGFGFAGTLLFLAACVVYAFPDIVCDLTKERLLISLGTLLRYMLPWIGLKLLWRPGNYYLCRLSVKLFSRRCQRHQFLNFAQLVFGLICFYLALQRSGLTNDFECRLQCLWQRTFIHRIVYGCCSRPTDTNTSTVDMQVTIVEKSKKRSYGRKTSKPKTSSSRRTRSRSANGKPKTRKSSSCSRR